LPGATFFWTRGEALGRRSGKEPTLRPGIVGLVADVILRIMGRFGPDPGGVCYNHPTDTSS